jgi:hypothetical protein
MKLVFALILCAFCALAEGVDGHWNVEAMKGAKKDADQPPASFSLDLKTVDGKVSGTIAIAGKKKPQVLKVENAKFDGTHLTFSTTQKGKNAAVFNWDATLNGDQLSGTRTRDGAKRGQQIIAKRN